jgi:hypothetical protein
MFETPAAIALLSSLLYVLIMFQQAQPINTANIMKHVCNRMAVVKSSASGLLQLCGLANAQARAHLLVLNIHIPSQSIPA